MPSDVRLTIIVASTRRPTLGAALESATAQMLPGDELIVAFDDSGDAGDTPRNRVIDGAHGTHIMFLDDDDELRPGALSTIRDFARANPGRIGIFRVNFGIWGLQWREEENLSSTATAMYVVPNMRGRIGRFGPSPGAPPGRFGDYAFIVETVALQGVPVWRPEVIQDIRPERRRLRLLRYRLMIRTRLKRALGVPVPRSTPPIRVYAEAEQWGASRMRELRGAEEADDSRD